jgi:hypothetical protein
MEKTNSEKAIEKIEFLIDRLINYSESNKYDYALYKSFAKKSSKAFKRYFSEIDDQTIKDKIISDLKEDFHFKVNDVVIKMMAKPKGKIENFENGETYQITQPSQDNRIEGYESNYKELIELFFYSVQLETKEPQEPKAIEKEKVEIKPQEHTDYFKDNAFEIWERLFENFNIDKTKRTDLRFMYEIMKHKGQIHKTVTVKSITDWINETYDFGIDKLQYTNIKSKSNENRMSIYNLIE